MEGRIVRLDQLLVERGFADSRTRAQHLIRSGVVQVAGELAQKPSQRVHANVPLEVGDDPLPYVGRGGLKLAHALQTFDVPVRGRVLLDVGASTGGFTQVLLEAGAERVIAVDVGRGQLHPALRADRRVVVMEQTDIRTVSAEALPFSPTAAVIDVSFISLEHVLPAVDPLLPPEGDILALVKPQFEVGPQHRNRRGVVRDPVLHQRALERVYESGRTLGWALVGVTPSPILGGEGNREFLVHWRKGGAEERAPDFRRVVTSATREG